MDGFCGKVYYSFTFRYLVTRRTTAISMAPASLTAWIDEYSTSTGDLMNSIDQEVNAAMDLTEEALEPTSSKNPHILYATAFSSLVALSGLVINILGDPSTGCGGWCITRWRQ